MTKAEETLNAIGDADTLPSICGEIASGGTLVAYCAEHGLDYKLVNRWLNDEEERAKRYKLALDIREEHAKDLIISELIAYLKAKPSDAFERTEGGEGIPDQVGIKPVDEMPPELQRLIAGVEFEEVFEWQGSGKARERVHVGRIHKIKFWDKPKSIETFMRHLSMLVERKDVNVRHSLADLVAGSMLKPAAEKTGS